MKNKPKKGKDHSLVYPELENVARSGDVTGMEPTPPHSEAEEEGYRSLYQIPRPKKGGEHKKMKDPGGKA